MGSKVKGILGQDGIEAREEWDTRWFRFSALESKAIRGRGTQSLGLIQSWKVEVGPPTMLPPPASADGLFLEGRLGQQSSNL
jgi:hypothetical protein